MIIPFDVGITVLKQYDELYCCISAVRESDLQPDRIIVVDNGGELHWREPGIEVITPGRNVGCAGGWNLLLKTIRPKTAIIMNDDCVVARDTLKRMMEVPKPAIVHGLGWACFRQDDEVTEKVGFYDENFWPAYYEDSDYQYRINQRTDIRQVDLGRLVVSHGKYHNGPYQNFTPKELAEFKKHYERNKQYFISKWGEEPSRTVG